MWEVKGQALVSVGGERPGNMAHKAPAVGELHAVLYTAGAPVLTWAQQSPPPHTHTDTDTHRHIMYTRTHLPGADREPCMARAAASDTAGDCC